MKNKTIWFLCLIILLSLFLQPGRAQSIKRQAVGSYGINGTAGTVFMSQTIGQPFFTSGYTDSQVGLAPGFQQPKGYRIRTSKTTQESVDLAVYPNPAFQSFAVESSRLIESVHINVTDLHGRSVWTDRLEEFQTYRVNSRQWQPGLYIINVTAQDRTYNYKSTVIINK